MNTIIVEGKVEGKQRPRFRKVGNFVQTYTPKQTKSYEKLIADEYKKQCGVLFPAEIPLELRIRAFMGIPSTFSKKKKTRAIESELRPTKKPDADNIAKSILDGLNGVAYADDKQVVELSVKKYYGTLERVEIDIQEVKF